MSHPTRLTAIRIAVFGLIAFSVMWWALTIYLHMQWSYAMPKVPDPASGRVYRLVVNHGWVIFVTAGEARFFGVATRYGAPLAVAAFFIAAALTRKYHVLRRR
jgi:hypothetical protein